MSLSTWLQVQLTDALFLVHQHYNKTTSCLKCETYWHQYSHRLCRAASKIVWHHTSVAPRSSEMACPWRSYPASTLFLILYGYEFLIWHADMLGQIRRTINIKQLGYTMLPMVFSNKKPSCRHRIADRVLPHSTFGVTWRHRSRDYLIGHFLLVILWNQAYL